MELETQNESVANMLGYYEYMCWYCHDQAHELDPMSPEHQHWYNQFRGYWAQKISLLHGITYEQALEAVEHLVVAVQHHDTIELQGVEQDFTNWLPAIWELNEYYTLLYSFKGLSTEIAKKAAEVELQRWYAHRQKRFDDFARLTNELLMLEFSQQLPDEVGKLFAQAAECHDVAEKRGELEYWKLTRVLLQEHFKLLLKCIAN
ncbi:MAG: hypothetical protein ACFFDH_00135 [Promethearchaeota archaeon]